MYKKKDDEARDITFIVTTSSDNTSSAANKKRVRSVAALKSWPERRKRTFESSQTKLSSHHGGFILDVNAPISGPDSVVSVKERKLSDSVYGSTSVLEGPAQTFLGEEPLFEKCMRATSDHCNCEHCRAERNYRSPRYHGHQKQISQLHGRKRTIENRLKSRESAPRKKAKLLTPSTPGPSPSASISGRGDPFNSYPVPSRPWFDYVLKHMMEVFAPRGWPSLHITNAEGRRWEWFMTQHALAEPALFYVRLLFATGDLVRLNCVSSDITEFLQTQAIQAINEALSDPKRATSDALILAVGRIALHETLYGNRNAATNVHRPAQKRMIFMRGGMKVLPFPELVKRLMRWSDTVMSRLSSSERLLEDDDENQNFSMKQHVDVLDKWVPTEARELSKKVKIADLLSPEPAQPP